MKKIIILSLLIIAGIFGVSQFAFAENGMMSLIPASANKNVGTAFDIAVQADPQGNEVCVIKAALAFDNLTCQNISVASGLVAQTAPTCSSPSFVLGIPKCATALQDILIVSVKGNNAGQANLSFSDINVLGPSAAVAFSTTGGTYNITAVLASQVVAQGVGETTPETTPAEESTLDQTGTEEINLATPTTEETNLPEQPAALGQTAISALFSDWLGWLILAVIVAALITWWVYSVRKEEKKPQ